MTSDKTCDYKKSVAGKVIHKGYPQLLITTGL